MNENRKKCMTTLIIILVLIIPLVFMILDLFNITKIIPLTSKYDWLAFIGTYISGLSTIILGIVSTKQNKTLADANKKMLTNNMITTRFSQIDLEKEQFYDSSIKEYNDDYGIKMTVTDVKDKSSLKYNKIILHLNDKNDLPLTYGKIHDIELFYGYKTPYVDESKRVYHSSGEEVKLEVTPHEDKITYYLPICILDDEEYLNAIFDSSKIRIVATIYVKNAFNVVSKAEYTIHLNKNGYNTGWVKYSLHGRKIYFKEITFDDNE